MPRMGIQFIYCHCECATRISFISMHDVDVSKKYINQVLCAQAAVGCACATFYVRAFLIRWAEVAKLRFSWCDAWMRPCNCDSRRLPQPPAGKALAFHHIEGVVNPDMTRIQLKLSSSKSALLLEAQTAAPDIDRQLIIEFKRAKFPKAISPPILGRNFVTSWTSLLANKIGWSTRSPTAQRRGKGDAAAPLCTLYVRSRREFPNELDVQNLSRYSPLSTGLWKIWNIKQYLLKYTRNQSYNIWHKANKFDFCLLFLISEDCIYWINRKRK